ncbi:MAG TPA: hypothetical protein VMU19_06570 [Bryobacteraceae bacterium]|nr:hypothetical protein [Bryobacteraceae bacterium]
MRQIEWAEAALHDMAALDREIARRVKQAVERFAATGAGNIRKLQGIEPPEFRLRVGGGIWQRECSLGRRVLLVLP